MIWHSKMLFSVSKRGLTDIFAAEKNAEEWHPEHKVLEIVESKIKEYQSVEDAGEIQEILRNDYEQQRQQLADIRQKYGYEQKRQRQELAEVQQELDIIRKQEELEPDRDDACVLFPHFFAKNWN